MLHIALLRHQHDINYRKLTATKSVFIVKTSSDNRSLVGAAAPASTMSESAMHKEQCLKNYETVFTNVKAGMQGVDRDKIKQIVYEISKDSAHFREEQRKQV
jgi:hypothetical protein